MCAVAIDCLNGKLLPYFGTKLKYAVRFSPQDKIYIEIRASIMQPASFQKVQGPVVRRPFSLNGG